MLQGVPSLTSSVTVEVSVVNVATTAPRFTDLFSAEVREDAPLGTVVLRVTSTDPDPGAVVTYSLSSNPNSSFSIDSSTGIITTAKSLDSETRTEYILRVAANDGSFNTETSVTVTVLDINDKAPFCQQTVYRFQMVENKSIATFVGIVMATDLDVSSPNHDVFFRLRYPSQRLRVNSSSNSVFTLGAPQFLSLGRGRNPSPENLWHVTVSAVDRGMPPLSTECELFVEVLPENFFSPNFSATVFTAAVPSNASRGFEILRLTARQVLRLNSSFVSFNSNLHLLNIYTTASFAKVLMTANVYSNAKLAYEYSFKSLFSIIIVVLVVAVVLIRYLKSVNL